MSWSVETLNATVVSELEALPADMRAKFSRIAALIVAHGLDRICEPYVKHLGDADERSRWHIARDLRGSEGQAGCGRQGLRQEDRKDAAERD